MKNYTKVDYRGWGRGHVTYFESWDPSLAEASGLKLYIYRPVDRK